MADKDYDLREFEKVVRSLGKKALEPAHDVVETARAMVADGKGLLAADESTGTLTKRFDKVGIGTDADTRRAYREMLFTTPGLSDYVSGVILYDETIRQTSSDGTPFPQLLDRHGMFPGIKLDVGTKPLAGSPGEQVTEGLDGLRGRLDEYVGMGARFGKWRAVITIGDGLPSRACIQANAHAMARYAALCQEAGVVPVVEPEVLMDGGHTMEQCEEATAATLLAVFDHITEQNASLEGLLLKVNMVLPGKQSGQQASAEQIAEATVRTMRRTVPAAVPGIVFLSGGQSAEDATVNLNAMNQLGPQPWALSFSYARALQGPAMEAWKGEAANVEAGQNALKHRARCNSAAATGEYTADLEAA